MDFTGSGTIQQSSTNLKILVVQTAFLGDLLLATPLLKNIKRIFSGCHITLVCRRGFGDLFINLGLVEKAVEIEKKNQRSYLQAVDEFNKVEFDYIFSPHESMTTAKMVAKISAKQKIGFRRWWNFLFFDTRIKKDYSLPDSLRQISLLMDLDSSIAGRLREFKEIEKSWHSRDGLLAPVPDWASPLVSGERVAIQKSQFFSESQKYVVFFPGSVWKTKQWTEKGFSQNIRHFHDLGYLIVLLGTQQERDLCDRVSVGLDQVKNLAGQTSLLQSLAILAESELVIANDSAGQHLAALVGTKTVTVFGPTVQKFGYRAWNTDAIIVEKQGLTCRPCGKHGHHKCPIGTHDCMNLVSAKMVITAAEKLLNT